MGKLGLDLLEPGMVVGGDVHDRNGRLLLGSGTELTQKHLLVFRTWGVDEVEIEGHEGDGNAPPLPPEVTPELLKTAEDFLGPIFKLSNTDHPAMAHLFRLAALRKAGNAPF